jgi:ferredoxin/flavodoxin---NADP+ reductase
VARCGRRTPRSLDGRDLVRAVAVVGAGPSGIFATAELVKADTTVDVLDRLPSPFGLVRYGVAPDHLRIKSVATTLARVLRDPRARYLGNVEVGDVRTGADVSIDELLAHYDAVVLATGAPHPRWFGVPGEDLPGNHAAGDLVSWYNGHPTDGGPLAPDTDHVVVVGAGNVSLDVARVLLKGGPGLRDTDVPRAVLARLEDDPVRTVEVVVRKGVTATRFSVPELLEVERIAGLHIAVDRADLELDADEAAQLETDRVVAQRVEVFRRWAERERPDRPGATLRFRFHARPAAITGDGRVEAVVLHHRGRADTVVPTRAVVRAIGYAGAPVAGVPFDHDRRAIPNDDGVVGPRLYIAGWAKRGPSGIIGTNKACATATVRRLSADLDAAPPIPRATRPDLFALVRDRGSHVVTWDGWERIDAAEIALGATQDRARSKISDLADLLDIAAAPTLEKEST